MSTYTLAEFSSDVCAIVKSSGQAGLPRVYAESCSSCSRTRPSYGGNAFEESMPPGKRVIFHDSETDVHVLAHVHPATQRRGSPHTHGTSWAVYGNAKGSTGMTIWRRENAETDAHAELRMIDEYSLDPGCARAYPSGAIHATQQNEKAWVIRVTGTDLDALQRFRFNPATDKLLPV